MIGYFRQFAGAITLLGASCGTALADASDAGKTFVYVARVHAGAAYAQTEYEEKYANDPQMLDVIRWAGQQFNLEDFTVRYQAVIDAAIPADEAAVCAQFASTEPGEILVAALEHEPDPDARERNVNAIPVKHRAAIMTFLTSPCRAKAFDLMNSERFSPALREYGESLVCERLKEVSPKELKRFKKLGKCLGPVQFSEP